MKALVTYFSQTGNTEKVARAIFDALPVSKQISEMKEVESLDGFDIAFIGFPIHAFGPAARAKTFLKNLAQGKKVALFVTHASHEDNPELEKWLLDCRRAAGGALIMGLFNCQGELSEDIAEILKANENPELRSYGEQRFMTLGQPDEERLNRAASFAARVTSSLQS